jgi:hypothetical protein
MDHQPNLDLLRIPEPPILQTGKKEEKEEHYLLKELDRQNLMRATAHWWKRVLLGVSFGIIIIIILIRVWGLVTPTCWQWLTEAQNTRIDEFFLHGTIGAIVAGYIGRYFKEKE